jgi:hypothetical protein
VLTIDKKGENYLLKGPTATDDLCNSLSLTRGFDRKAGLFPA